MSHSNNSKVSFLEKIFPGFTQADLSAGFVVFLIALPLSIGIALASGAPATSGVIAAAVGGMLGSLTSGGYVTINGPAAGLIVIVLETIQRLGKGDPVIGFKFTLAACIIAGVIQVVMGRLKLASLGLVFPSSVVHGMMAAIGAIIIAKQSHVLLGVAPQSKSILGLFAEIPHSLANLNPEIALIGFLSISIMLFWHKIPKVRVVPAPLVAACLGLGLGLIFDLEHHHTVRVASYIFDVDPKFLLSVPDHIQSAFMLPSFGAVNTFDFWRMVVTICLVASLESTLSAAAVDKLDPLGRSTDLNKDLTSKGLCNILSASVGGLPMIAEIVRSSANVSQKATSQASNFIHGAFVLLFVALFPALLHEIPLASLAAILIVIGWRLTNPSHFKHAYHIGWDHVASFCVTFAVTLATDLLVGIAAGVITETICAKLLGARLRKTFFSTTHELIQSETESVLRLKGSQTFLNLLKLAPELTQASASKKPIRIDCSETTLIDHNVMVRMDSYRRDIEKKGQKCSIEFADHKGLSDHQLSTRIRRLS